jgi:hypothetical protein
VCIAVTKQLFSVEPPRIPSSSMTNIESAASQMMQNRDAVLSGGDVLPELVVDWDAGY